MRVPAEFSKNNELKLGAEFKNKQFGTISAAVPVAGLEVARPPVQSFLQKLPRHSIKNDPKAMLKAIGDAGKFHPNDPELLAMEARLRAMTRDKSVRDAKKAIECARKAIELSDDVERKAYYHYILALAYRENGQLKEAVEAIEKALPVVGRQESRAIARAAQFRKELEEERAAKK